MMQAALRRMQPRIPLMTRGFASMKTPRTRGMTTDASTQEPVLSRAGAWYQQSADGKLLQAVRDPVAFACVGIGMGLGFAFKMLQMRLMEGTSAEGSSKSDAQTANAAAVVKD
jgi:hypothetical protein